MAVDLQNWVVHFLLLLVRMSALFILSPVFGRANLPATLKILLASSISLILINIYPPPALFPFATPFHLLLAVIGELICGLAIGYVTTLFFSVVFTAGSIIDMQIGFGMVQIYDVQTNASVPVVGSLLNLIILESFLITDGHLKLIILLSRTVEVIPIGQVHVDQQLATLIVYGFVQTFVIAVNISMPIIASAMVAEVGLGIVVRTSPQMNVFVLGMPIKVILGILMMLFIIPVLVPFTNVLFDRMFEFIDQIYATMLID